MKGKEPVAGSTKKLLPGFTSTRRAFPRVVRLDQQSHYVTASGQSSAINTNNSTTHKHNDEQKNSRRGEDIPRERPSRSSRAFEYLAGGARVSCSCTMCYNKCSCIEQLRYLEADELHSGHGNAAYWHVLLHRQFCVRRQVTSSIL